MKLALIQTNPTIADIDRNTAAILDGIARARDAGAELAIFCEQAILGYPAKDLLLRREIIGRNVEALHEIARHASPLGVLIGYAEPNAGASGRPVYNSAALLHEGSVVAVRRKRLLPTYDVFDEARYFEPAGPQEPVEFAGRRLGITICEDLLAESLLGKPLYSCDPVAELAQHGVDLLINISASPFVLGKRKWRVSRVTQAACAAGVPFAYVNQVGGNDELLFDGGSCVIGADGSLIAQARAFAADMLLVDLDNLAAARKEIVPEGAACLHDALIMGLHDYLRKCGFGKVVVGLSGGIDSAVVAALAASAFGPENVHGVAMPSRFSSDHSITDARALAKNLGIRFSIIEIEPMHAAFEHQLRDEFTGRESDVAEENIQARVRGGILMALSNKFGSLLLTTGNKSELAVGYCTLYGDMAGGLAVISDVPKTMVYTLARHINERAGCAVIPESTLTKPPSAELRPDQTDQDSLPPYDVLDAILERYEERLESIDTIVAAGFDREIVRQVVRLIQINEYKRSQAAPGLKVTSRAFGFGRRLPIAARPPR
ncbi:MAG: NAD+ synthase [Phycisphaerae bacterium]|nr:NAD+ synthase [Phycisphaerae bacterium]